MGDSDLARHIQEIARELGVFDGARPVPITEVVDEIIRAIRALRQGKVTEDVVQHIASMHALVEKMVNARYLTTGR